MSALKGSEQINRVSAEFSTEKKNDDNENVFNGIVVDNSNNNNNSNSNENYEDDKYKFKVIQKKVKKNGFDRPFHAF